MELLMGKFHRICVRKEYKMSNKERVNNILHYQKADRMPAVHFGYWFELLEEWAEQGHISKDIPRSWADGNETDRELDRLLGWDFNWFHTVGPQNKLFPAFEYKVLEKLPDGFMRVQNGDGLIERIREGAGSIPAEEDYQLKDREAFETLYKPKMQFSKDRVDYKFFTEDFVKRKDQDLPIGLNLGSVLGDVRNMLSVIGMSYLMCDDYDLFAEIIDTYAEMQYQCAEEVLKTGAKFDFAHY